MRSETILNCTGGLKKSGNSWKLFLFITDILVTETFRTFVS